MAVFKVAQVQEGLGKLEAEEDESRRHLTYKVYDDSGTFLGETYISHSAKEIDDNLLGPMARQLKITLSLWKKIIGCSKNRSEYIRMASR
jgi:hypothetical protein